ncbi:hypothetical protein [Streptomyces sp. NBC_01244]|uniref:hypothetical protein n=1 Tax=Streptomyces sp. NBC_01244 TaxID=2903797 RepID=UPI002E0D8E77|nr:hypothetical protein OG247_43900 [Streptomyces sp. NBC_01244]
MGAHDFEQVISGATLPEAFRDAVEQAQHEYGPNPYSGTVGMKDEVLLIEEGSRTEGEAQARAHELIEADDERISDKWGPAGALPLHPIDGQPAWLLFGWVAS